ncbi:MAG: tripartite tricarboxylate transporter substrate binding protein [Proteobacteria bacterium]|nr:tripartite tricarboxylate transporter substrate binding protein [Pseudomonadota bacterium]
MYHKIIASVSVLAMSMLMTIAAVAETYPSRPITMVVGFGIGGSADRMTRSTVTFLSDALEVPVKVVNKKGAGTMLANNYLLRRPADGYTVLGSTFSPYMSVSILMSGAKYSINDFAFINAQWFDRDIVAVHKDSPYKSLPELVKAIKNNPKKISCAVVQGSSGHLMSALLLKEYGVPQENMNLVTYQSGGKARSAIAGNQVSFIIIGNEGSMGIKEFLRPLAFVDSKGSKKWNAPAVNDALKPLGYEVPLLSGSIRGFAVSRKFKEQYPERFDKLVQAFKTTLTNKDVKKFLKRVNIGHEWTGPDEIDRLMKENHAAYVKYKDLLN